MPVPGNSGKIPENQASIQTPTYVFQRQHEAARPCLDLMGGTEVMRHAGARYITRKEKEPDRSYNRRIERTVLRNVFAQTISYYRGQVFSRQVALDNKSSDLTDEQLERFRAWAEDVDQRGHNLTAWSGSVFTSGLVSGVTFCLVDYPHIETINEDGVTLYRASDGTMRPKTAAADAEEGWQPYLVHIPAEQVLDCRAEWRNGRRVITHFRYVEIRQEQSQSNQFVLEDVKYVHAYWLDRWELWRFSVVNGQDSPSSEPVASGNMTLNEIPVAVFMPGDPRSDFTARPALMDLAHLNIKHWRASSEQEDLMAFSRLPVWTVIGAEREIGKDGNPKPLIFGPGNIIYLSAGGSIQSVGVDPLSVDKGQEDLVKTEADMATYGLKIMQSQNTAKQTATQVQRESREGNSQLRNWALDFQDFLENCLHLVGLWWGMPDGPSAKVNDDFADSANMVFIIQNKDALHLSSKTLTDIAVRLGVLPDDYSYEDETALIAQEMASTANAGQSFGLSLMSRLGAGGGGGQMGNGRETPGNSGEGAQ